RPRPGLRPPVELRAHPVAPPARHERQDDVSGHNRKVLMRASLLAAAVIAAALAPAPARAQSLSTRFGATTGYRMMLGDLGKRYQHGWSIGMEAGAQVGWLGILLSLQRSVIYSAESDNFDNSVFFLEASATLRPRIRLHGEQTALYVQA